MSPRWLMGLGMLFILLTITSNIIEQVGDTTGAFSEDQVTVIEELTEVQFSSATEQEGIVLASVDTTLTVLHAIWRMLWFDYSFFDGNWRPVQYAVFWPITIAMLLTLALTLWRALRGG